MAFKIALQSVVFPLPVGPAINMFLAGFDGKILILNTHLVLALHSSHSHAAREFAGMVYGY